DRERGRDVARGTRLPRRLITKPQATSTVPATSALGPNPDSVNRYNTKGYLNLGGPQPGVDTTRTSAGLIQADARDNRTVQRKIVLALSLTPDSCLQNNGRRRACVRSART